jgi:hypothetical protein
MSEQVTEAVKKKKIEVLGIIVNSNKPDEREKAHKVLAALNELEKQYQKLELEQQLEEDAAQGQGSDREDGLTEKDPRRRKVDLMRPKPPRIEPDETQPDRDEERIKEGEGLLPDPFLSS